MTSFLYDIQLDVSVYRRFPSDIPGLRSIEEIRTYSLKGFPLKQAFIPEGETVDLARTKSGSYVRGMVQDIKNGLGNERACLYVTLKASGDSFVGALEKIIAKYQ